MKKEFKIILLLICIFSFKFVKAETILNEINKTYVLYSSNDYKGLACNTDNLMNYNVYVNDNGDVLAELTRYPSGVGTETVTCTYSAKKTAMGFKNVSNGTLTHTFSYDMTQKIEIDSSFSLDSYETSHVYRLPDVKRINNITYDSKYVTADCKVGDAKDCVFSKTPDAGDVTTYATIEYETNTGANISVSISIRINVAFIIRIYPGNYGTCNVDESVWKKSANNKRGNEYYVLEGESGTLPSCNADNSAYPLLEFAGWVSTDASMAQTANTCVSYINRNVGDVIQNNADGERFYFACYKNNGGVTIHSAGADFTSLTNDGWTTRDEIVYYHKADDTGKVVLPVITKNHFPSNFDSRMTFKGWQRNGTKDLIPGGTSVDANGASYIAIFSVFESEVEATKTQTLQIAQNYHFDNEAGTINSCYAEDTTYISVNDDGGDCIIYGAVNSEGKYTTVVGMDSSGQQYVLRVKVVGITSEGGVDGFEVDTNRNIIFAGSLNSNGGYLDRHDSNTAMTQICNTFHVVNREANPVDIGGISLLTFNAKCTINGEDLEYESVCLDPSKISPTNNTEDTSKFKYRISSTISPNTLLGRVVAYINKEVLKNHSDNDLYAANIAVRLIDIYENGGSKSPTDIDVAQFEVHEELANLSFNNSSQEISLGKSLGNVEVEMKVKSILKNALCSVEIPGKKTKWDGCTDYGVVSENNVIDKIVTSTSVDWAADYSSYTINYEGYILLPEGVTGALSVENNCSDGFTCTGTFNEVEEKDKRRKFEYKVSVTALDASNAANIPSTGEARKKISFILRADGLNIMNDGYILKPLNGTNRQRLVMFNSDNPPVYLYFSGAPQCNVAIPVLDYTKCTGSGCPSEFNGELFAKAGCCDIAQSRKNEAASYVYESYCTNTCSYSNVPSVCEYNPDDKNYEDDGLSSYVSTYKVNEGVDSKGNPNISGCVVKVNDNYEFTGGYDEAGNSLVVQDFEELKEISVCQISCKEDWDFSMSSFGNYVGKNAIAAGSFFSFRNPIVINGSRTCYTSYIDYNEVINQIKELSEQLVDAYNEYMLWTARYVTYAKFLKVEKDSSKPSDTSDIYEGEGILASGAISMTIDKKDFCADVVEKIEEVDSCDNKNRCECDENGENCSITKYVCEYKACPFLALHTAGTSYYKYDNKGKKQPYSTGTGWYDEYTQEESLSSLFGVTMRNPPRGLDFTSQSRTCPTNFEGHPFYGLNTSATNQEILDYLFNDLDYASYVQEKTSAIATRIVQLRSSAFTLAENLYNCQHFQLHNIADVGKDGQIVNDILTGDFFTSSDGLRNFFVINSPFDPEISYTYEEKEYMTMIGDDNILVEDTLKNNFVTQENGMGENFNSLKSVTNTTGATLLDSQKTCIDYKYKVEDEEGNVYEVPTTLCHNDLKTSYYAVSSPWGADSEEGRNYHEESALVTDENQLKGNEEFVFCYTNDGSVSEVNKYGSTIVTPGSTAVIDSAGCYNMNFHYYKVNYVKQTLRDGSFYTINGKWYIKKGDLKSYAYDGQKESAMQAVKDLDFSKNNKALWSALGSGATFPIKITTRRNLYQYTFTFGKIGSFSNGSLGRIMGEDISVIKINDRSCFYEVYEAICKCCGNPINTEAHLMTGVTTKDYIKNNGVDYKESDYTKESKHPELGFFDSVVSLNDINGDTGASTGDNPGRILGINWNNNEPYFIDGYRHSTDKGKELAAYIEAIGENIYSYEPEYSFKVSPGLMSQIRNYNEENGYEIELGKFTPYGVKSMMQTDSDWKAQDDSITLVHLGSKFLEGTLVNGVDWFIDGSQNNSEILKSDNVCEIESSELKVAMNNMKIYDMVKNQKCRWIDYIDSDTKDNTNTATKYRLAFK